MRCDFALKALINDYHHLHISAPIRDAKPGHYIVIDDSYPCYIMGQTSGLELIANPTLSHYLRDKKDITISALQGQSEPPPQPSKTYLLLGENEALNTIIFYLKNYRKTFTGLVILQSDSFPFIPCPSRLLTPMLPSDVIAALPLLEDWGIVSRLASSTESPGVYQGTMEALADYWLASRSHDIETISFKSLA